MKKKNFFIMIVLGLMMILGESCVPTPPPPTSPPLNSALAAHGNANDWHIDTAHEFLFGTDMAGNPTAANHCPNTWTRTHIHVGLTNTADFYQDADLIAGGDDTDATSGIDTPMLFFYAGHGEPTNWDTLGNDAFQVNMSLGDSADGGLLRYYWQCSCEVFAHGPQTCTTSTWHYGCPGDFTGGPDSVNQRNVYERWGPVLNPDLRMACGASTPAYCHEYTVNKIWYNYNVLGYDVADSFIDGLNWWGVVPLCITQGGVFVSQTPLYDAVFTNLPNTAGTSYYHIQYLDNFATTAPFLPMIPLELELMPIFELIPRPLPDPPPYRVDFFEEDGWYDSKEEIEGRGPQVRYNTLSGAVFIRGERIISDEGSTLSEEEYIRLAQNFIDDMGWDTGEINPEPLAVRFVLSRIPVDNVDEKGEQSQKNVVVSFKRQLNVDGQLAHVIGDGGVIQIQMNNDGTVMNANMVWREIGEIIDEVPVKTFDFAFEEALAQLENPDAYKLGYWNWGYEELDGTVEQHIMSIIYQFNFEPVDPEMLIDYPPRTIVIPGQKF
jgi:hypothetical protein